MTTTASPMLQLLRDEASAGVTVLLSSHHLAEVDRACDQLMFLHEGRLLSSESASAVRERAERALRVEWPATADMAAVQREIEKLNGLEVTHHGRISVQSELGHGTQFTIELPIPARIAGE